MPILIAAISVHQRQWHVVELAERHLDVLRHGQRAEQRAVLKQNPPALLDLAPLQFVHPQNIGAEHLDLALDRPVEPDDGSQQHRFAAARPADHAEDLAAQHIEVEAVMHRLGSEPVDQTADLDDRLASNLGHRQIFKIEKKTEKAASATITRKIDSTTERVVRRPTLSALRET